MAKKITKRIALNLKGLDNDLKSKAKNEVGRWIVDKSLEVISTGKSPVKDESRWERLNKAYADAEKGGSRVPNMELSGDMLDNYGYRRIRGADAIEVGILGGGEDIITRADSHNHHIKRGQKAAGNPKRRFIPKASQNYSADITAGIKEIIKDTKKEQNNRDKTREERRKQNEDETSDRDQNEESIQTTSSIQATLGTQESLAKRIARLIVGF